MMMMMTISLIMINHSQPTEATLTHLRPPRVPATLHAAQLLEQTFESARLAPTNYSDHPAGLYVDSRINTALARKTSNQLDTERLPASNHNDSGKVQIISRSTRTWQPQRGIDFATSTSLSAANEDALDLSESKSIEHMNCALILKRTYIVKSADADEWGDKFVFNDVDSDVKKKKQVFKSDLCIKHSDVDRAIEEAKHKVKFEKSDDLDSLELSDLSIADVAELNLAAGRILTKKFDLSHDEILNALPMIDMSSSKFYWKNLCPKHVRSMICTKSRYRTITAHCNNLKHPSWGAAKTPYSRYLPPDYADGLSAPRASRSGQPLPSARLISSIVHRDADERSNDYSALFASWGQLLNHDITRIAVGNGKNCSNLACT